MEGCDEQTSHRSSPTSRRRSRVAADRAPQLHDPPGVNHLRRKSDLLFTPIAVLSHRSRGGEAMTHAMRSASLAGAVNSAIVDRQAIGELVAGSGEIASVDGRDDLIETIPRLALMLCSATAAELMEVEADGELKLLSRSGEAVDTPCQRIQFSLRQSGRNLVLIVWGLPAPR